MNKRKSFVFARQCRNFFSRRINALLPRNQPIKTTNQNRHGDVRFSWLEDDDLPPCCRHCLLLTCSYRDNPTFSRNVTPETCSETKLKTRQIQDC